MTEHAWSDWIWRVNVRYRYCRKCGLSVSGLPPYPTDCAAIVTDPAIFTAVVKNGMQ